MDSLESSLPAPSTPTMTSTTGSSILRSAPPSSASQCWYPETLWVKQTHTSQWGEDTRWASAVHLKVVCVVLVLLMCFLCMYPGSGPALGAHTLLQPPRRRWPLLHRQHSWQCGVPRLLHACRVCVPHRQAQRHPCSWKRLKDGWMTVGFPSDKTCKTPPLGLLWTNVN